MLFGKRRGIPLTLALATTLGLGLVMARSARADGMLFQHTIPREVDAYDFTTGRPYMAPPVPYGHYAKDYVDEIHKCLGCATCQLHGLMGGGGLRALAAFTKVTVPAAVMAAVAVMADGRLARWTAVGNGRAARAMDCSDITAVRLPASVVAIAGIGAGSAGYATTWAQPSGQAGPHPSGQSICGQSGCTIAAKHSHLSQMLNKIRCGSCGGTGCGACAGTGATGFAVIPAAVWAPVMVTAKGRDAGCAAARAARTACRGSRRGLHGKLASIAGAFNKPKISWFNGAGGPVPLTPGYVPYIVATRSPRDFFSFPPMNPNAQ